MDLDALKAEIDSDPLTRGYAGMDDAAVAASLNTADRSRNKTSVSGSDVFAQIDATEFNAKTADQKRDVLQLCAIDSLDPFGVGADIIVDVFGGGSTTVTTLAAFRVETISRAEELGLGVVATGHVEEARRLV